MRRGCVSSEFSYQVFLYTFYLAMEREPQLAINPNRQSSTSQNNLLYFSGCRVSRVIYQQAEL